MGLPRGILACAWLAVLIVFGVDSASAQQWPSRIVRIIVPSAPGDGPDSAARVLAPHLEHEFGQPFIVDNMPGAGGVWAPRRQQDQPRMVIL